MREIDLDAVTVEELLDHAAIAQEFKKYLMDVLGYDNGDADFVTRNDFANPYDTPFIEQDFEGEYTIGGKDYEVRSCKTNFMMVGLFHLADVKPFEFYMLFDKETLPDNCVGSYQKAEKKYII